MLSEVFYTILLTTISGMLIKLCSMAYKSKCKEVSFCCIKIIRDVEAEDFSINRSNSLNFHKKVFIAIKNAFILNLILCIL